MSSAVLLPASFAILLAGALLFTNAIEWFGSMVGLGQSAVGSLLAAVATALPESLIPIVAVVGGEPGSEGVAIGRSSVRRCSWPPWRWRSWASRLCSTASGGRKSSGATRTSRPCSAISRSSWAAS